jgi:hypothetical protein
VGKMKKTVKERLKNVPFWDEIDKMEDEELDQIPVFNGEEMEKIEKYLTAKHEEFWDKEESPEVWGFWRNWKDETPPKFKKNRDYYIIIQGGWYTIHPVHE